MDWNVRYRDGHTPWDLGGPALPLRALFEEGRWPLAAGARIFVPGAGYGHDALFLAERGHEVEAIDIAPLAVEHTRREAAQRGLQSRMSVHELDLFALPAAFASRFDAVYELTCYCAIDPALRPRYAEAIDLVLRPGGLLLALMFPLAWPDAGPPFAVLPEEFEQRFAGAGFARIASFAPGTPSPGRAGNERWLWLEKPAKDPLAARSGSSTGC